jgi:hypothetical protein
MAVAEKTFAVTLTIPDNEAFTALETLVRLGVTAAGVRRSDIWTFTVDAAEAPALAARVATIETIFNPNKHRIEERATARPLPGEVWIAPYDETEATSLGGRALPGVRGIVRRTAWRILDPAGNDVDPALLDVAIETFLCNPAFQKAIR